MKSIVQEASSIKKAVEQAWESAGKPKQFSVKILELPQKNFFGFTTRSAKIALLFNETATRDQGHGHGRNERRPSQPRPGSKNTQQAQQSRRSDRQNQPERERRQEPRQTRYAEQRNTESREQRPVERTTEQTFERRPLREEAAPKPAEERVSKEMETRPERQNAAWESDVIKAASDWLTETLDLMGYGTISYTTDTQENHLKITLSQPIVDDELKEKYLLSSLATLMLATIKRQHRKALGYKVIFVHADAQTNG